MLVVVVKREGVYGYEGMSRRRDGREKKYMFGFGVKI
jgi:hypothetical protein